MYLLGWRPFLRLKNGCFKYFGDAGGLSFGFGMMGECCNKRPDTRLLQNACKIYPAFISAQSIPCIASCCIKNQHTIFSHWKKSQLRDKITPSIKVNHHGHTNFDAPHSCGWWDQRPGVTGADCNGIVGVGCGGAFLRRVVIDQAFPLELKVSNAETRASMQESRAIMDGGKAQFAFGDKLFADLKKTRSKLARSHSS